MADRVTVVGIDPDNCVYRPVHAEAVDAHILLTCDGSDSGGESLLTPDQAHFLALRLSRLAEHISAQFTDDPAPQ